MRIQMLMQGPLAQYARANACSHHYSGARDGKNPTFCTEPAKLAKGDRMNRCLIGTWG